MLVNEIATFAARFNVSPSDARALPAVFENAAKKVNMSVRGLVSTATYNNRELGEYLAAAARKVAPELDK